MICSLKRVIRGTNLQSKPSCSSTQKVKNMLLLEYLLLIISSLLIAEYEMVDSNNATEINRLQSPAKFNLTSEYNNFKSHTNRRSVVIINSQSVLRSSEKKLKTAESLLYEEYGEDGKTINSVMMYNLNDVSNFFKTYLNTEICNVRCDEDN